MEKKSKKIKIGTSILICIIVVLLVITAINFHSVINIIGERITGRRAEEELEATPAQVLTPQTFTSDAPGVEISTVGTMQDYSGYTVFCTGEGITIKGLKKQLSLPISLIATVNHEEISNQIDISGCKYIVNTSDEKLGTDASSYTGTFTNVVEDIPLSMPLPRIYYLHILTTSSEGEKIETISKPIVITANVHTHTGSPTTGGGCYTKAVTTHTYCPGILRYNGNSWDPNDGTGRYVYQFQCDRCGRKYDSYSATGCVIGNGQSSISHTAWFGPLTTTTTYELNCGQEESSHIHTNECYNPIYHTHTDSCYTTTTCTLTANFDHWSDNGTNNEWAHYLCPAGHWSNGLYPGRVGAPSSRTCGYKTTTLTCGKTEQTIEGYDYEHPTCGYGDGESYTISYSGRNELRNPRIYRYIKLEITKLRGTPNNEAIQLADWQFLDGEDNVFSYPTGVTITSSLTAVQTGQSIEKILDGNTSTKYCSTKWGSTQAGKCTIKIDLGAGNAINFENYTKYRYYTADDQNTRDPISWNLYGSEDEDEYFILDVREGETVTTTRKAIAGTWEIRK